MTLKDLNPTPKQQSTNQPAACLQLPNIPSSANLFGLSDLSGETEGQEHGPQQIGAIPRVGSLEFIR